MDRPDVEPATPPPDGAGPRYRRRARFEVVFTSIWLAVGLFVLPATIFFVGGALLGPYGDNGGVGRFYGDFFGDLAEPSARAWAIALGPLVLISLLRLVFAGVGHAPQEPQAEPERAAPPRRTPEEVRRVEPSVSAE